MTGKSFKQTLLESQVDEEFIRAYLTENDMSSSYDIKDGKVHIKTDFGLESDSAMNKNKSRIPVDFIKAEGNFDTTAADFSTLEGYPTEVGGDLELDHMKNLTSLKHCPVKVFGYFSAQYTGLTDVEGFPIIESGGAYLGNTPLTSLHNIHKTGKMAMHRKLNVDANKIKSHVLGVLIVGPGEIINDAGKHDPVKHRWIDILNKYLAQRRTDQPLSKDLIYRCQEELIDAGFDDFAAL